MPIPSITPYPMPRETDLPANMVHWRPRPERAALLIHDMQEYFLGFFPAGRPPFSTLMEHVTELRNSCAELGIPVVYTAQPGRMTSSQRGLLHDFWGPGMSTDGPDRQITGPLEPRSGDTVLTKWRYSAFHRTGLRELLARWGRDQLIVCGVYASVGCLITACDAYSWDIQPFLAADAVADFSPENHQQALGYAARCCAVTLTTRRLLSSIRETVPTAAAPQSAPPPTGPDARRPALGGLAGATPAGDHLAQ